MAKISNSKNKNSKSLQLKSHKLKLQKMEDKIEPKQQMGKLTVIEEV